MEMLRTCAQPRGTLSRPPRGGTLVLYALLCTLAPKAAKAAARGTRHAYAHSLSLSLSPSCARARVSRTRQNLFLPYVFAVVDTM